MDILRGGNELYVALIISGILLYGYVVAGNSKVYNLIIRWTQRIFFGGLRGGKMKW